MTGCAFLSQNCTVQWFFWQHGMTAAADASKQAPHAGAHLLLQVSCACLPLNFCLARCHIACRAAGSCCYTCSLCSSRLHHSLQEDW